MHSGKAKKVRRLIRSLIPANTKNRHEVYMQNYKEYLSLEKRKKIIALLPKSPVALGKRHHGESLDDFKARRKKANYTRRRIEKTKNRQDEE